VQQRAHVAPTPAHRRRVVGASPTRSVVRARVGESSGAFGSYMHAITSGATTMRFGPRAPAATSEVDGVCSTTPVSRFAPSTTS